MTDRHRPATARSAALATCIALIALCLTAALPARAQEPGSLIFNPTMIYSGAYSPKGTWFAMGYDDLMLFTVADGKQVGLLNAGAPGAVSALHFAADESRLAVLYTRWAPPAAGEYLAHEIAILSLPDGKELARFPSVDTHYNTRLRIRLSPDASRVAVNDHLGITVYDTSSGEVTWSYKQDKETNKNSSYNAFDVTPDWTYFLFNLARISYPEGKVDSVALWEEDPKKRSFFWDNRITPDGTKAVAIGGPNGTEKRLYDLVSGKLLKSVPEGLQSPSRHVTLTPDGTQAIFDGGIWNLTDDTITTVQAKDSDTQVIAVSPTGKEYTYAKQRFDLSTTPPTLSYWVGSQFGFFAPSEFKADTGKLGYTAIPGVAPYAGKDTKPQYNKDDFDKSVRTVNPSRTLGYDGKGTLYFPTKAAKDPIVLKERAYRAQPYFIGDDVLLLMDGLTYFRYDNATGKTETGTLPPLEEEHFHEPKFQVSGDGKWMVRVAGDFKTFEKQTVEVFDATTFKPLLTVKQAPSGDASFTLDSSKLTIWSGRTATVYTCGDWEKPRTFTVPLGRLHGVSFSPDGSVLALGNRIGITWLYTVADGTLTYLVMPRDPSSPDYIPYDPITVKPVPTN